MTETRRYVIERAKGTDAISAHELCAAIQVMPNGWGILGIQNRDDGTTVVHLQALTRQSVAMPK